MHSTHIGVGMVHSRYIGGYAHKCIANVAKKIIIVTIIAVLCRGSNDNSLNLKHNTYKQKVRAC